MTEILVYIFSFGAFLSGFLVISTTNPIHSVFSLVMCFVNSSILLLMLGFEFLALLFMVVYVGALAILFLFVVMMLNVRLVELIDNLTRYLPIGLIIGIVFLFELLVIVDTQFSIQNYSGISNTWYLNDTYYIIGQSVWLPLGSIKNNNIWNFSSISNVEAIGSILYTEGYLYFLISSLVLLVAMVGAIVMTLYHEQEVRRQDIFSQITTDIKLRPLNTTLSKESLSMPNRVGLGAKKKPDFRLRN